MKPHTPILSLLVIIVIIFCLSGTMISFAQAEVINDGDVLIYVRDTGDSREYISVNSQETLSYTLPLDRCSLVSPDGVFIAQAPVDAEQAVQGELVIFYLDTEGILLQIPWQPEWRPCFVSWIAGEIIRIRNNDNPDEIFYYDISSGNLTPTTYTYQPPTSSSSSLPNWIPDSNSNLLVPSPNPDVFLYDRCNSGELSGTTCIGERDFVIYDTARQQEITTLSDAGSDWMYGYRPNDPLRRRFGVGSVAWSHDGRYLAYVTCGSSLYSNSRISIYDTKTNQITELRSVYAIDPTRAFQWSLTTDVLSFWTIGRGGEPLPDDDHDTLKRLYFYDMNTGQIRASEAFDLESGRFETVEIWSPDGLGYALIDLNDTLHHIDITTGDSTIIDTDVARIVAWRTEE